LIFHYSVFCRIYPCVLTGYIRYLYFKITKVNVTKLLFLGPRGLITILLFLSIPVSMQIPYVSESLMILVIVFSSLSMMFGIMFKKNT